MLRLTQKQYKTLWNCQNICWNLFYHIL